MNAQHSTQTFAVRGDHIQLDQLLKATGLFASGGEAHAATTRGEVQVDGKPETRKRAKLRAGQVVECGGARVSLTGENPEENAVKNEGISG